MGHRRLTRSKLGIILTSALILSSGLLCPLDAFSIGISPPRTEVQVEPNQTIDGKLTVMGRFDKPTRVRAIADFWSYKRDGSLEFAAPRPGDRSLAAWLTLAPAEFVLNGQQSQVVRYRLKVPADVTGSYWGAVHFRTTADAGAPGQTGVGFQGSVTAILIASTKRGAARAGALTEVAGTWTARDGLALRATFQNQGNLIVKAEGRFELIDARTSKLAARVPIQEALVLPGGVRDLTAVYAEKLAPGPYLVRAVVDYGNPANVAAQRVIKVGN